MITPFESVEAEGRRLAWRTVGDGPPLLLLNGYSATAADWDPSFLAALADSHTLICPDNRGVGGSELGDPAALTIDAMTHDVEAVLDALGLDAVPVAGWSMGGFVAQALALRNPARVRSLALLGTDAGGPTTVRADPAVWARLVDHSGTPREQAARLIALLFPPALAPEIDRQFGDLVAEARAGLVPEALRAQEAAMDAWHASEPAPPGADAPPVLAVCGTEDVVIPPENAEVLAARWPRSDVERIPGAGHAFMAQEPERTASMIGALVR